jgi:hypothetical protein
MQPTSASTVKALKTLLGGLMAVPKGTVPAGTSRGGHPKFDIKYDVAEASKLMAEAGCLGRRSRMKAKVQISASGSGQMQPLPMNAIRAQQSSQAVPLRHSVRCHRMEHAVHQLAQGREGSVSANGAHATNVSFAAMDPFFAMVRFTSTKTFPPVSNNWGYFGNAEFDGLICQRADQLRRQAAGMPHWRSCMPGSSRKHHSFGSPMTSARER